MKLSLFKIRCSVLFSHARHETWMEAPLKDCTTLEQRAVIRFLNAEGIQTSQICQRMKNIYDESCLSQKTFINGLTSSKMDELHVPILNDLDDQVLQRRQAR
ncbi:hypothetical protein LAZ67_17002441 [Cordylochernes scorpioides]|uniref:Mos1 transposase HTH domain-containing protein n=1 Tax=Cordylochernes scorpioides TaxID=51811 RepID=A0ABY6LE99_9ARAC|nr:hypothetical protein LAZ67_17002441 [Cordylochernes scorpioides]